MSSPFLWGVASAAFQVEGALTEDGRAASVWDTFARRPGAIRDGHSPAVACDHYHRWEEDADLLERLGVNAYRFSVAWPRVVPQGRGAVNEVGLDFYDRLVDALLERGVTPVPTLFHWDLPQALEEEGGWTSRDTAHAFAEYAGVTADRLGDRVGRWITLNEPVVHMAYGHAFGVHAPGRTLDVPDVLGVAHHLLLAHGLASRELRSRGLEALLTNNYSPVAPATGSEADAGAATAYDALHNRLFTDPVLTGVYPDLSAFGAEEVPGVLDGDLELVRGSVDGIGVNYYNPSVVAAPGPGAGLPFDFGEVTGVPTTAFGWPVVPEGLGAALDLLVERYGDALPPLYVTENGASYADTVAPGGHVADPERISYLEGHVGAVEAARGRGVDVRGYFVWTLTDNFEWAEGYHQRFGLVHVDHATQVRTPKDSFAWYRDLIASRTGS
ncbi:GH1 family beta-glucosidase [Nocardiopsis sp. CT-R113]|uniref:Beta-glucosidase n=1 Tax=Nocardiopsis codii TaxID=3065942 RepID=A0ABU7KDL7_9ACTN|nr:GH1 family beta-glucosidase [Nocardiopsis sp. CT-R113]MEE2040316.1 GH1 family beta-glucosidase [Nocardiopsis sp. CT-R113]